MTIYNLETEEDMISYLDTDFGHGRSATFTNSSNETSNIKLILNNEYFEEDFGEGVESLQPIAFCRSVDVPEVVQGNSLNISAYKDIEGNIISPAKNYIVVNVQKDRTGFTTLILREG